MGKQDILIVGCGGAGVNLVHKVAVDLADNATEQFATVRCAYLDTAESNRFSDIAESDYLHVDGAYGSGKVRTENHEAVLDPAFVTDVFRRFTPGAVTVVVHSGGGGSGPVIGYGLVKELMSRGESVIVMVVGSKATRVDLDNTNKSLKSLDGLVRKFKQPLALFYRENNRQTSREQVDNDVYEALLSLAVLWSGNNRELDRRDLENWLRYDRVTTHPVELNQLLILGANDASLELDPGTVASVATLAEPGQPTDLDPAPEVQFVGYFQKSQQTQAIEQDLPIHFVLARCYFSQIADTLEEGLNAHKEVEKTRPKSAALLTKDDKQTDDGLVV